LSDLGVEVVELPDGGRDLNAVLNMLAERDLQSILVEGGTEVAGSFSDAKLVDKVTFIVAPIIVGGDRAPNAIGGNGAGRIEDAITLEHVTVEQLEKDIEITGYPKGS
jgi:diaminohydroxyphosphoribosylaminopyrimidine deaminase/5-amino-6-(5-phosphoribosylamino)uracil reductase